MRHPRLAVAATCALGLILVAGSTHSASPDRPIGEIMADAVKARDAGDLDRTVELLREAYGVRPAPELLNNLGKILEQLGRYREAVDAYQKVADDPKADAQLRSLDTSRVAALQPKLNRSWVLPKITPRDAMIYVDGQLIDLPPGVEFSTSHRKHIVLVVHPDEKEAVLTYTRFPLERRTDFVVDLNAPDPTGGSLTLVPGRTPREIRVNGKSLGDGIRRLRTLRLPAGNWDIEVIAADGQRFAGELTVVPNETRPFPVEATAFDVLMLSDGDAVGHLGSTVDAGLVARSKGGPSTKPLVPWVGAAVGAVTTGVGVALMLGAVSQQDQLEADLHQGDGNLWTVNDTVKPFSVITYREAQARQEVINGDSRTAGIVTALGSAVLLGSTVWALLSLSEAGQSVAEAPGGASTRVLVTPHGVGLLGRF